MISEKTKALILRGLAFSSTLFLSFSIFGVLPGARARRQMSFAEASMDGNLSRMRLLHLAGANVNARINGSLPLLLAAGEGRLNAVRYLLDEGADVNAREPFGHTALTEATYNGHMVVVKELLVHGADVNAVSQEGTALDIAVNHDQAGLVDMLRRYGGKRANEMHK